MPRRLIRLVVLAVATSAMPLPAGAQDTTVVSVGTRLRITTNVSAVTGALQSSSRDTIVLDRGGTALRLPRERIIELERFAGQRTYKLRGALIGGGVLGVVMGTVTYFALANQETTCEPGTDPFACVFVQSAPQPALAIPVGLLGGLVGAGIGAFIGATPRDQYEPIPAPWRIE